MILSVCDSFHCFLFILFFVVLEKCWDLVVKELYNLDIDRRGYEVLYGIGISRDGAGE